jgi:hypothetical protein
VFEYQLSSETVICFMKHIKTDLEHVIVKLLSLFQMISIIFFLCSRCYQFKMRVFMKKRLSIIIVASFIIFPGKSFSLGVFKKEDSCFPLSNITYEAGNKSLQGISEIDFDQLITFALTVMGPEVQKRLNKKLIIQKRWEDATIDAFATRDDFNNAVVVMNGGLARHPSMTREAFLLLICHEIGHHLGGAPRNLRGQSGLRSWSSAEGQADYYATSKCLPAFYKSGIGFKNLEIDESTADYSIALSKCQDNTCAKLILAGLAASKVFASVVSGTPVPRLGSNDSTKVSTTLYRHPNPQCRLDTYLAGANCDLGPEVPFDTVNPKIGACVEDRGVRPACWFQENDF